MSVNRDGSCAECAATVSRDAANRLRIIQESAKLVDKTTNPDTLMRRLQVLSDNLNALLEYERQGISTITPSPSELLARFERDRTRAIRKSAEHIIESALAKAKVTVSQKSAITTAEKALVKLQVFRRETNDAVDLAGFEARLTDFIHDKQLEGYLEGAKKAEFKGNRKKAIDSYQEALYLLRTDAIDDAEQTRLISEVEAKIEALTDQSK